MACATRSKKCGLDGRQVNLGYFSEEIKAAEAVDAYFRAEMPLIAASALPAQGHTRVLQCHFNSSV